MAKEFMDNSSEQEMLGSTGSNSSAENQAAINQRFDAHRAAQQQRFNRLGLLAPWQVRGSGTEQQNRPNNPQQPNIPNPGNPGRRVDGNPLGSEFAQYTAQPATPEGPTRAEDVTRIRPEATTSEELRSVAAREVNLKNEFSELASRPMYLWHRFEELLQGEESTGVSFNDAKYAELQAAITDAEGISPHVRSQMLEMLQVRSGYQTASYGAATGSIDEFNKGLGNVMSSGNRLVLGMSGIQEALTKINRKEVYRAKNGLRNAMNNSDTRFQVAKAIINGREDFKDYKVNENGQPQLNERGQPQLITKRDRYLQIFGVDLGTVDDAILKNYLLPDDSPEKQPMRLEPKVEHALSFLARETDRNIRLVSNIMDITMQSAVYDSPVYKQRDAQGNLRYFELSDLNPVVMFHGKEIHLNYIPDATGMEYNKETKRYGRYDDNGNFTPMLSESDSAIRHDIDELRDINPNAFAAAWDKAERDFFKENHDKFEWDASLNGSAPNALRRLKWFSTHISKESNQAEGGRAKALYRYMNFGVRDYQTVMGRGSLYETLLAWKSPYGLFRSYTNRLKGAEDMRGIVKGEVNILDDPNVINNTADAVAKIKSKLGYMNLAEEQREMAAHLTEGLLNFRLHENKKVFNIPNANALDVHNTLISEVGSNTISLEDRKGEEKYFFGNKLNQFYEVHVRRKFNWLGAIWAYISGILKASAPSFK